MSHLPPNSFNPVNNGFIPPFMGRPPPPVNVPGYFAPPPMNIPPGHFTASQVNIPSGRFTTPPPMNIPGNFPAPPGNVTSNFGSSSGNVPSNFAAPPPVNFPGNFAAPPPPYQGSYRPVAPLPPPPVVATPPTQETKLDGFLSQFKQDKSSPKSSRKRISVSRLQRALAELREQRERLLQGKQVEVSLRQAELCWDLPLAVGCRRRKKRKSREEGESEEIDKWLDALNEKNLRQKREAELKREADLISGEVRRKAGEGRRAGERLALLQRLRAARQENARHRGLPVSGERESHFESRVGLLRMGLNRRLEEYGAEERALRVMVEGEQPEEGWRRRSLLERRRRDVHSALFGGEAEPEPSDPLFLFWQHHNAGNSSLQGLLHNRQEWDVHATPTGGATSVPAHWVPPSSSSWDDLLAKG